MRGLTRFWRSAVRESAWLTAERARVAARMMLGSLLILVASTPWTVPGLKIGYDFGTMHDAARLALAGLAVDVHGRTCLDVMMAVQGERQNLLFFYPPTALFFGVPFAPLPFPMALGVWLGMTGLAYALVLRAVAGSRSIGPAIGFPAVFTCALLGQNSLLSAALFGGAALMLDRSPRMAGVLLGCLAYKPQLAVLAPLALMMAGRWQAFASAALSVTALVLGSVAAFGLDSWGRFFESLEFMNRCLGEGENFAIFASVYGAARLLHASHATAWMLQAAAALCAAVVMGAVAWRRPGGMAEIATLTVMSLFCIPFLGDYDLVVPAVAGAWIVGEAKRGEWLAYERVTLALLFLAPLAIKAASGGAGVPLGPVMLGVLASLVVRRSLRPRR